MHIFITTNKNRKFHYDDIKEIHIKDSTSVILFDRYGSMEHYNIEDVVKVEVVIEESKAFPERLVRFNERNT